MKGRNKFAAASGRGQDESLVRMDFNVSKPIGNCKNVRNGRYFIFYQDVMARDSMQWLYVDYKDIVWAYRRFEDVQGRLCRVQEGLEVHSLMLVTKDRKRIGILIEGRENALEGLNIIRRHNTLADIGFTKEKEEKYL